MKDDADDAPGPRISHAFSRRARLTRRDLLRHAAATGLGYALLQGTRPLAVTRGAVPPQRGGTLRVGWIPNAHTLDPHYSVDFAERHVMYAIYNTLVAVNASFEIVPELARSWKVAPDGQTVTFELQPNVKFHDGTACDATAVKWNMDFILSAANTSPQRRQLEPFLQGVEASGPTTAVLHLKKPYPGLLAALAERPGFMVSPTAWQKLGKDLGRQPVGTGMFQFVEWLSDDHVTIKRNDGYWDRGKPYLDAITYRVLPDPTLRSTMVRTEEVDVASQPDPKDIPSLERLPNLQVVTQNPSGHWWATQWRVDRPPFNNKALRQAIAYGVDREEFVKVMLSGRGTVAKGPTPPTVWWYNPGAKGYTYDPAKAKGLLAEAGHGSGFEAQFSVDNTPLGLQFAQLLQQQLKKINVNITINPVNPADLYQQVLAQKVNWARTDWTLRGDPDGLLSILFYTGNYANSTGYTGVDKLLDDANATYDRQARKKIYAEVEQRVIDDAPYVWFFYVPEYAPMRKSVQNYVWIPDSVPRYRELWLAK
jgi:peptide/nickel transport system substrate-binding protein